MPSGENLNSNPNSENSPEVSRPANERRGEAANRAELEAREREFLEELARLEQQRDAEQAEVDALKRELGIDPAEIIDAVDTELGADSGEESTGSLSPEAAANLDKARKKQNLKKTLQSAVLIALAASIAIGGFLASRKTNKNVAPEPTPTAYTEQASDTAEKDQLHLSYDYTHWADFENKSSKNAYDYDYSDCFDDDEKTKAGWYEVAERTPEALSSYVYYAFTEDEKADLGIANMSPTEIDDLMSDPENPEAGAMQKRLLEALKNFMDNDAEFVYYYENDTENSHYIYFVDENGDNIMTPDEMHLGYSTVKRNGAAQVDVYRTIYDNDSKEGRRVKVLDLNLYCGFQPNFELPPADVPFIPNENDPGTGSEGTGDEGTGSEGTGSEGTGSEGTGSEGTGSEGTGSEGTGTEGTGVEGTGYEGTGYEGTGYEGTGNEITELTPKDEAELIEHAGDRVDVQDLDMDVTPRTTLEEDQANFEEIERQRQEDAERAAEAERVRIEQAEAERRAAEEAEARRQAEREAAEREAAEREAADREAAEAARQAEAERQAAADEAARRAAEEAAELQRQAAEAERQAAAEREAAARAQAEADRQAAANAAEAESNADATAAERADMFNNRDF